MRTLIPTRSLAYLVSHLWYIRYQWLLLTIGSKVIITVYLHVCGSLVEWLWSWTCNQQVAVRIMAAALLNVTLGIFLHMCASVTKQYNLTPARGWLRAAGEVTVGLAESNGNLPPCLWRCPPADQLQSPTLILIFTLNVVSYVIQSRWFCGMLHLWWSCDRALLCWVRYMNVCTDFVPPCESVCVYIF